MKMQVLCSKLIKGFKAAAVEKPSTGPSDIGPCAPAQVPQPRSWPRPGAEGASAGHPPGPAEGSPGLAGAACRAGSGGSQHWTVEQMVTVTGTEVRSRSEGTQVLEGGGFCHESQLILQNPALMSLCLEWCWPPLRSPPSEPCTPVLPPSRPRLYLLVGMPVLPPSRGRLQRAGT